MDTIPASLRVFNGPDVVIPDSHEDVGRRSCTGDACPMGSSRSAQVADAARDTMVAPRSRRVSLTALPVTALNDACRSSVHPAPKLLKSMAVFHDVVEAEAGTESSVVRLIRFASSLCDAETVLGAIRSEAVSLRPALLCQFAPVLRQIIDRARRPAQTRAPNHEAIKALMDNWHLETVTAQRWLLAEPPSAHQSVALSDLLNATLEGSDRTDYKQTAHNVDDMLSGMMTLPMAYWPGLFEAALRHGDATAMLHHCVGEFVAHFDGRLKLVGDAFACVLGGALFRCKGAVEVGRMLDYRFGVSVGQQRRCVEPLICAEIVRARIDDGVDLGLGSHRWRDGDIRFRAMVDQHLLDVLAPRLRADASWRVLLSEYGALSEATCRRAVQKVFALERDVIDALGDNAFARSVFIDVHDRAGQIADWSDWLATFHIVRRMDLMAQPALMDRLANCLRRIPVDGGRAAWLRAEYAAWKNACIEDLLDDAPILAARAMAAVMKIWADLAGPAPRDSVPLLRTMARTAFARVPISNWGPILETLLDINERHGHACKAFVDTEDVGARLLSFLMEPTATMICPLPVFVDYAVNWSVHAWSSIQDPASQFPTTRHDAYCDRLDLSDGARERVRRKVAHLSLAGES